METWCHPRDFCYPFIFIPVYTRVLRMNIVLFISRRNCCSSDYCYYIARIVYRVCECACVCVCVYVCARNSISMETYSIMSDRKISNLIREWNTPNYPKLLFNNLQVTSNFETKIKFVYHFITSYAPNTPHGTSVDFWMCHLPSQKYIFFSKICMTVDEPETNCVEYFVWWILSALLRNYYIVIFIYNNDLRSGTIGFDNV